MHSIGLRGAAAAFVLVSFLGTSTAFARDECDRAARVCVTVPDSWTRTAGQNGAIVISAPDRTMALELRPVTQANQFAPARTAFEGQLTGRFANLQWQGEPVPAQQHGMQGVVRNGQGNFRDGTHEAIRFFLLALAHQTGGVIGLGIVTERGRAQWAVMEMILNSIRPMT